MAGCIYGYGLSFELITADGTIYYIVVASCAIAIGRYVVLYYGITRCVAGCIYGYGLSFELLTADGTIYYVVVASRTIAIGRYVVLYYGRTLGMTKSFTFGYGCSGYFGLAVLDRAVDYALVACRLVAGCLVLILLDRISGSMSYHIGRVRGGGELCATTFYRAVYYAIVATLAIAGCNNFVLHYCRTGSMRELCDLLRSRGKLGSAVLCGTVYYAVVATLTVAGCRNNVLIYCRAGSMRELCNTLGSGGELCLTALNGTVYNAVVATLAIAGCGNYVLLDCLTGGVTLLGAFIGHGILGAAAVNTLCGLGAVLNAGGIIIGYVGRIFMISLRAGISYSLLGTAAVITLCGLGAVLLTCSVVIGDVCGILVLYGRNNFLICKHYFTYRAPYACGKTGRRTSGICAGDLFLSVAEGIDLFGICVARVVRAGVGLNTVLCTGGVLCQDAVVIIMTYGINYNGLSGGLCAASGTVSNLIVGARLGTGGTNIILYHNVTGLTGMVELGSDDVLADGTDLRIVFGCGSRRYMLLLVAFCTTAAVLTSVPMRGAIL